MVVAIVWTDFSKKSVVEFDGSCLHRVLIFNLLQRLKKAVSKLFAVKNLSLVALLCLMLFLSLLLITINVMCLMLSCMLSSHAQLVMTDVLPILKKCGIFIAVTCVALVALYLCVVVMDLWFGGTKRFDM